MIGQTRAGVWVPLFEFASRSWVTDARTRPVANEEQAQVLSFSQHHDLSGRALCCPVVRIAAGDLPKDRSVRLRSSQRAKLCGGYGTTPMKHLEKEKQEEPVARLPLVSYQQEINSAKGRKNAELDPKVDTHCAPYSQPRRFAAMSASRASSMADSSVASSGSDSMWL